MSSPMDKFFALAPKDPKEKANFDFWLMLILFVTFVALGINYLIHLSAWCIVMFISGYFIFGNLTSFYNIKKMYDTPQPEVKLEIKKI